MHLIPSELAIGGVYIPPLLIAGLLGVVAAALTARLLNRVRWVRWGPGRGFILFMHDNYPLCQSCT